jgi:hypothetical protein
VNEQAKLEAKERANKLQMDTAYSCTDRAVKSVERLILNTPTGPQRDALTEANIHLQIAKGALIASGVT